MRTALATFSASNTDSSGFQNLLSFSGISGADLGRYPYGDLTLIGSTLYGMTGGGAANSEVNGQGTIFSIHADGSDFQNLLSFNDTNGAYPIGDLTLSGSSLYGMTIGGGANNDGVVFS